MTIQIEKDVPLPPEGMGRPAKYPFRDMEIGDSFSVPLTGVRQDGQDIAATRLRSRASSAAKEIGRKFAVRTDNENNVVRCWRVE